MAADQNLSGRPPLSGPPSAVMTHAQTAIDSVVGCVPTERRGPLGEVSQARTQTQLRKAAQAGLRDGLPISAGFHTAAALTSRRVNALRR